MFQVQILIKNIFILLAELESVSRGRNMKKIAIGFCIVLMLLIPSSTAMTDSSSERNDVIKSQNTDNNDGLADLKITDIFSYEYDTGYPPSWQEGLKMTIKNVGDTTIPKDTLYQAHVVITRMFFGIFPIKVVDDYTWDYLPDFNLPPGTSQELVINEGWTNRLDYGIGFFKIHVTVSVDVEEENYDNNKYFVRAFGYSFLFIWWDWVGI